MSGDDRWSQDEAVDVEVQVHAASVNKDRILAVDGLRATAFLLVFAFHTWQHAGSPYVPVVSGIVSSNTRPDFFVVLTGFVLFLPFARDVARVQVFQTRRWLARRLRRVVLPYYAALAFAIAIPQVLKLLAQTIGHSTRAQALPAPVDVLTHLTFTHLFFPDYWASINGSLWTMSLEMQLYLIFPVLMILYARFGPRALIGALAVSLAYRVGVALWMGTIAFPASFLWGATGLGRLMEFLAGMLAATMALRWRGSLTWSQTAGLVVTFVAAYVTAVVFPSIGPLPIREPALGICFGSLVVLAVASRWVERIFAWRPLSRLGYMAYSMFLVHEPVSYFVSEFLKRGLGVREGPGLLLIMWTVALAVVFAFGYAFFRLVERPCIAWSRGEPVAWRRAKADPS